MEIFQTFGKYESLRPALKRVEEIDTNLCELLRNGSTELGISSRRAAFLTFKVLNIDWVSLESTISASKSLIVDRLRIDLEMIISRKLRKEVLNDREKDSALSLADL